MAGKRKNGDAPKVGHLPGMKPPVITAITRQALKYRRVRDERMELLKVETEEKATLLALMQKHGLVTYADTEEDVLVERQLAEEDVKVKHIAAPEAE